MLELDFFIDLSERPTWLKFLLESEPRTPICQNGDFFCHLAYTF